MPRWQSSLRRLHHVKASPNKTGRGAPLTSEGQEGDMQVRMTENGVAIFAKLQGNWHKFTEDVGTIGQLTDSTGGTVSNAIPAPAGSTYPTDNEYENGMASIVFKINEIIKRLG
jgi:hypothetical protein